MDDVYDPNDRDPKEVPCKWCGTMTDATALVTCVKCWEIERHLRYDRCLVRKMLKHYDDLCKED